MNEKQIKHFFREYELNVWSRNKPFLYFTFITEAIYGWCSRQHWRIPSTILHTKNVEKKCVKYRCCHSHSPTQKLKILLGLLWIFYSCILSTQIKKYMFYFTHKLNRLSIKSFKRFLSSPREQIYSDWLLCSSYIVVQQVAKAFSIKLKPR